MYLTELVIDKAWLSQGDDTIALAAFKSSLAAPPEEATAFKHLLVPMLHDFVVLYALQHLLPPTP